MPKLMLFTPCRKVVIDQEDQSVSLIEVIQEYTFAIGADTTPLATDVLPISWAVFSQWEGEADDAGVDYEQRLQVFRPGGDIFAEGISSFTLTKRVWCVKVGIDVLPIGEPGIYRLELSLRRAGKRIRWQHKGEYSFVIKHKRIEQAAV